MSNVVTVKEYMAVLARMTEAEKEAERWKALATKSEPAFTEGHCAEKAKPGGCQLHNLHCGYPDCDRRLTERQVYDATR